MRLGKRERAERKLERALARAKRIREASLLASPTGALPISGSLSRWPATGTSKPGASLFRVSEKSDRPVYAIPREPRLSSRPKLTKVKRFANV